MASSPLRRIPFMTSWQDIFFSTCQWWIPKSRSSPHHHQRKQHTRHHEKHKIFSSKHKYVPQSINILFAFLTFTMTNSFRWEISLIRHSYIPVHQQFDTWPASNQGLGITGQQVPIIIHHFLCGDMDQDKFHQKRCIYIVYRGAIYMDKNGIK